MGWLNRRSRARRAALAMAASAATVLGVLSVMESAPAATVAPSVAVHEVYTIPTSGSSAGTFTIMWRGNGHGHGLSQYGARGAAQKGLNYSQILAFYYPGTVQAKVGGNIRVQLGSVPRDNLQVLPTSTLTLIDTATNATTTLPTSINGMAVKRWRLGVNAQGSAVVSYLQATWKSYRTLVGDGEFIDHARTYVTLLNPTTMRYHGGLLAASAVAHDMHRYPVNVVSLEQYVDGVVPAEMPTSWPQPALRSQAIAARTYALFERAENRGNYYDICDTTWCQVYAGMDAEVASSDQAVTATKGIYLAYQGKPAFTQFSSSNGGWESYGGQPYLPSQADPYTPTAQQVYGRDYSWKEVGSATTLQSAYPGLGVLRSITITKREGGEGATWQGRVLSMTLNGSKGAQVISGDTFAAIFGVGSTWFTLQVAAPATRVQTYALGAHVKAGWTSALGKPIGPERATAGFGISGYFQRFSQGRALVSSKYGTFVSGGSIFTTWRVKVRGWPTGSLKSGTVNGRTGSLQTFQKGKYGRDFAFATGTPIRTVWTNGRPS